VSPAARLTPAPGVPSGSDWPGVLSTERHQSRARGAGRPAIGAINAAGTCASMTRARAEPEERNEGD
jgi:hypothetical protein